MDGPRYELTRKTFLENVAKSKRDYAAEVFDGIWNFLTSKQMRELIYVALSVAALILKTPWVVSQFPPAILISQIIGYILPLVQPSLALRASTLPSANEIAEAVKKQLEEQKT